LDKWERPTNIDLDGRHRVKPTFPGPAGLALAAVLVLCVVAPPEVRGESLAASALFIAIAAAFVSPNAVCSPASLFVFAAVPVGLVAIRMAIAPGEAVEPTVCLVLAAVAGISARCAGFDVEALAPLFAALLALAGGRALYEALWGMAASAERLRQALPTADGLAILGRLEQGRPYGAFSTPAALGCFLAMTIPGVAAWALGKRGGVRAAALGATLLGAAGLVATRSVTAMAALVAALLLAGWRARVAPRLVATAVGAIVLAIVAAGVLRSDAVFAPAREDSPWRLRAGNIRIALEIARDHPWAGVGPGGFAEAFPQYRRAGDNESRHAHDLPAELLAEWGVPVGLALSGLFLLVFLWPVISSRGDPRTLASGLTIGLAAFALHNLADFTAFLPSLLIFAAVTRGLLGSTSVERRADLASRAAWIAIACAVAVVAAGAGLARDAMFSARQAAAVSDHAGALRDAERAMRLAPWDADPPQFAAAACLAAARASQSPPTAPALDDAEQAVRRAPQRAAARQVRALARGASGDRAGAYADFAEASRLYPLHGEYAAERDGLGAGLDAAGAERPR
jgi:O-antigen ligase